MIKTLLLIILLFFAVYGLCELIYIVKMLFYYPYIRVQNYSLIILKENYAVRQLDFLWQKLKWHGDSFAVGIIAIIDNINDAELANCNQYIEDKKIILCNTMSLQKSIALQGELINGNR